MAVATLEKPSEERCAEASTVVQARMKELGVTWVQLGTEGLGQSHGTARNVVFGGTSNPAQYVAISKYLKKPDGWMQDLYTGKEVDHQATPTFSDAPKAPAKKRPSGRKATAPLSRSEPKQAATTNAAVWSPAEVPEKPAGVAAGPNASKIAALQIRMEEVEAQLIRVSTALAACKCGQR